MIFKEEDEEDEEDKSIPDKTQKFINSEVKKIIKHAKEKFSLDEGAANDLAAQVVEKLTSETKEGFNGNYDPSGGLEKAVGSSGYKRTSEIKNETDKKIEKFKKYLSKQFRGLTILPKQVIQASGADKTKVTQEFARMKNQLIKVLIKLNLSIKIFQYRAKWLKKQTDLKIQTIPRILGLLKSMENLLLAEAQKLKRQQKLFSC